MFAAATHFRLPALQVGGDPVGEERCTHSDNQQFHQCRNGRKWLMPDKAANDGPDRPRQQRDDHAEPA